MVKKPIWFYGFSAFVFSLIMAIIFIEPLNTAVIDLYHYIVDSVVALFVGFFFVKGKFIFRVVAKKIILLSATGLGKRYLIERVLTYHFKVHFFNHIKRDLIRLYEHIKANFMQYSISKKIVAFFGMLASLGFITKIMGKLLALKVLFAKIWSFLLAISLKVGSGVVYFVSEYLWAGWLAPLLDILIFSWVLKLLHAIPMLESGIEKIYSAIKWLVSLVDTIFALLFQKHIQNLFRWMLKKSKKAIYKFIGYKQVSAYKQLQELRAYNPSIYEQLKRKRANTKNKRVKRVSKYQQMRDKKVKKTRSKTKS
jgi:hypothetical protein